MADHTVIQPALTPQEWKDLEEVRPLIDRAFRSPKDRHVGAATALHGQPFGFTLSDADTLRAVANNCQDYMADVDWSDLLTIAEKIEALLPPREVAHGE